MAKENSDLSGRQPPSLRNVNIYDATNSFVKKMTTKMTDLIPQSLRLSKWFNSTENIADTLDGKENTENAEFEEEQPPPNKRIRMDRTYPPGTFSIQTRTKSTVNTIDLSKEQPSVHSNMTEDCLDQATPGPSGINCLMSSTVQADIRDVTSHKSDLNSLTSLTNDGITNGTDDNSESSETSGCSSLIQQMNRFEGPALYSSTFSSRKRHIDDKLRFTSSLQSSKSSFLNSSSRETLSSRRPRFNESVVTNVLQRTSALSSPFYYGNTTFGGANMAGFYNQNRNSFNNSLNQLELKVPKRTNVEVTPNVTESDSSGMSQTAKKILEALEHFSSPISDAKKIPLKNASNAVSSILSRKRAEGTKKIGLRHLARELTVPTVPDILKLKRRQKLQDTTLTVRKIVSARSNPSPQDYWLRMELNDGERYRGKLKGKSKVNLEQEETIMPVNLPNIPLPITTLPNFNFSIPTPSIHFAADKTVANKENTFIFASPIKMINVEEDVESVKSFTFSNPIDIDDNGNTTKTNDLSLSSLAQNTGSITSVDGTTMPNFIWSGSSTAPRLKAKVKDRQDNPIEFTMLIKPKIENITDLLHQKSNKTESDAIGQSDLKLTSEKVHTDKTDSISASLTSNIKSTPISKSWECSECLIRNNDIDEQCNVCKVPRPDPENKTSTTLTSTTDNVVQTKPVANDCFGSHFKLSKDQWECTSCYVRNKRSDNKCVACCMPKSENTVQQTIKPQSDLMEKFKPAAGSWECSGCLLRNAENVLTCPCCDASKPNSLKKVSEKRRNRETITENNIVDTENVATQASVSNNSDVMNKFKLSKDSWECPGCLVRNNNSVTNCPCCSTAKPNSGDKRTIREHVPTNGFGDKFTKPKGAWNCDSCLLQNDAKHTECVACQAPKPGVTETTKSLSSTDSILQFKFGIPSSTSNVSNHSSGFKFDTDKDDTQSKSDTASSLNGFKFVSVTASQQNSGATQFTFGLREENKVTSEASKSSSITTSSISTGLNIKTTEESESTKKDSQNKQEISFNTSTNNNLTIANEKPNTSIVATSTMLTTPIFTFGVKKSESDQTALNKEKEKSTTVIESVKVTEEAAIITTISESTPITSKITLPTPIFSFGVPSTKSTDAIAVFSSTASTNATIPCLPTFAQSTFTFSDSKIMSQPSTTITTFGQVLTSTTLSTNLSFEENKVVETIASSFTKSTSDVSTTSSIFPVVSSSTSFFNNNTINNETKTTMAFGSDKSAFTTTYNKPSGFGTTENKYPAFGSSTEVKSSIFETSETKLPVFNPSSQTPASNPLPTFGAFGSNSTPVFGSVTTHGFSAVTTTPTVFSSTKPNEPTIASNSSLFTFGSASSQQPTSGGFNFTANANSAMNSPAAKPLFTFGTNSSTTQNSNNVFDGNTFGTNASSTNTPNFAFNPPKQETPIAFGQGSTPIFGTPQTDPQTQAKSFPSSAPSSTGFNFGSTASAATSGFNFGGPSSTSSGFNFNPLTTSTPAVAFDPNSRPSFNFTKGSAPTSFNATPQSTGSQPQRKIKKAFRRCVR